MKPEQERPPLERWVDLDAGAPDAQLGELFRSVADPEPLSAPRLAQVRDRLALGRPPSPARRRLRELTVVVVMMLAGSSLALAALGTAEWWSERRAMPHAPSLPAASVASVVPRRATRTLAVPPSPEPAAAVDEGPSVDEPAAIVPVSPRSSASARASADSSALAAETAALERVLIKLRRERDAQGALTLLDESQALFARGSLALEAQVARIDALLALGRKADALALLERLPFAQVGRGGELRLVRAELRAESDCARALSDFDVLVTQALASPLAERALYGRAACELNVGDRRQAEHDLEQYLARFPHGRFASEVQARLTRLKGP